jgi:hypothetical protein
MGAMNRELPARERMGDQGHPCLGSARRAVPGAVRRAVPGVVRCAVLAFGLGLLVWGGAHAEGLYPDTRSYRDAFEARCASVRSTMAHQTWQAGRDKDTRKRIYLGVVKVATGIDSAAGLAYLRDAVAAEDLRWGPFETYAFMDAVLRIGPKLPPDLVRRIEVRLAAAFGTDYGFTDNHKLQYRVARYLYGQTWPDGPVCADGMTPLEAKREAEQWITTWIHDTVERGMYEYDSPNYHDLYLLCFSSLYEYSRDPQIRQKSWMITQLLLADWAVEYLDGTWVGAHSREKYDQVTHTRLNTGAATQFGPFFFGGADLQLELPETYNMALAGLQAFEMLPLIARMATDRECPYVERELKAPRRGPGIVNGEPTWKYTYVTRSYALGSSWGDLTDVEDHRWDLTWVSSRDEATCFFINPSYSARQLIRYFDTTIDKVLGEIVRQRPYYADPNKWIEGSPYEDVFQHENVLVAIYDIPPGEARQYVNGFFPHIIDERREADGWILCRADSVYFGVYTAHPGEWHTEADHDRLTIRHPKTAVFMEVAQAREYADFDAFCAALRQSRPTFEPATMTASITSRRGYHVQFTYHGRRMVNGTEVRLDSWPLFDGPWIQAQPRTGIVTLRVPGESVVLDFNSGTVTQQALPGSERIDGSPSCP